mmetsp:Transcript_53227/g.57776  ORF Transcript_53227/g.57776 Transcript_53227/m.57776 type:complete len:81 (-) Transcript_53227:1097-1339(-)
MVEKNIYSICHAITLNSVFNAIQVDASFLLSQPRAMRLVEPSNLDTMQRLDLPLSQLPKPHLQKHLPISLDVYKPRNKYR